MKRSPIAFFVLASVVASCAYAQKLDWQPVEALKPNTRILVLTERQSYCFFQAATDDKLFCDFLPQDSSPRGRRYDLVFSRAEVREVHNAPPTQDVRVGLNAPSDDYDYSKGFFGLLLVAGGGSGWDYARKANAFAGVKIGGAFSLDLQYDRIQGRNGFSTEGSAVLPLFRIPHYRPNSSRTFVKVFAEPGIGYRAGGGPFGGYSSAKVMAVLLTNNWSSGWTAPYVEYQRRFPFQSPLQGDNRITVGVMLALCQQCGFN
jgi:hypothetical protein